MNYDTASTMSTVVEDGIVEYWLYPDNWDKISISELLSLKAQYESYISKLIPQTFLWNGAPFTLEPPTAKGDTPSVLHGKQFFGSDMQDEWFTVHLLFSLTVEYPDLTVRVTDTDGEFLLIEASDHLPDWLTPETSANRVFVRNGALRILSIPQSPADLSVLPLDCPATPEAGLAALLRAPPECTAAPPAAQAAIATRLAGSTGERRQRGRAVLPRAAAHVIRRFPRLAPHAANAFRGQDPDERVESVGESELGEGGDVELLVGLTRFTYAELMYTEQRGEGLGEKEEEDDMLAKALGRMLTVGLECIRKRGKGMKRGRKERLMGPEEKMIWEDCGDIEKALREVMKEEEEGGGMVPEFGKVDMAEVDSDDWMDVDPDEFDELLRSKTQKDLVEDVNGFMMRSSEFDGVKGGLDSDDDDDDDDIEDIEDDDEGGSLDLGKFDPDKMLGLIRSALMGGDISDKSAGINREEEEEDEEELRFQEELEREIKNSTLGEMYNDGGGNDDERAEVAAQCLLKSLEEPVNPLSSLLYMNSHTHKK